MQFQEKQFQQPNIATPPPTHASQIGFNPNGMQMQQQQGWGTPIPPPHSPPPGSNSPFNPYGMNHVPTPVPVSPQYTGTTAVNGSGTMNPMNGMQMNQMNRPTPLYPGASVNMTATQVNGGVTNQTANAVDEGRMSVSIDFGVSLCTCE